MFVLWLAMVTVVVPSEAVPNWMASSELVCPECGYLDSSFGPDKGLQDYSIDAFNSLRHVQDATDEQADLVRAVAHAESVDAIGQAIGEQGLDVILGVSVLHNHFELNDGERLVVVESRDPRFLYVAGPTTTENLCPYMFAYSSEGWHVLQFTECHHRDLPIVVEELFTGVYAQSMARIGRAITEQGAEDTLGVYIRWQEDDFALSLEETDEAARWQTFRANATVPDAIVTHYTFPELDCTTGIRPRTGPSCNKVCWSSCSGICTEGSEGSHYNSHSNSHSSRHEYSHFD